MIQQSTEQRAGEVLWQSVSTWWTRKRVDDALTTTDCSASTKPRTWSWKSNLSLTSCTSTLAKKALNRLHHLYRGATESIGNTTNCYGPCAAKYWARQRMIKSTQTMVGTHLLSICDISEVRCLHKAQRILTPTQATACSPCCHLAEDKVSATEAPDGGAAFLSRLWHSWTSSTLRHVNTSLTWFCFIIWFIFVCLA